MKMIRNLVFVIFGSLILMSSKCSNTKVIFQDSPEFKVSNVYTQKLVPGEQNKKPYIEFGFEITEITNKIVLDSVFCGVGKSIKIKTDGKKRLNLFTEDEPIDNLKYSKALFYYSKNGSKYFYKIDNIKTRETMFLP